MKPDTLTRLLSDRLPNFQELKTIAPHDSFHLLHFTAAEGGELIHYAGKLEEGRSLTYREFKREPLPEFASLPHSILRWNGLNIGVDYLPGAVRFPNRAYAKKLRAGYGRIHGLRGEDGRSPRCFLYPGLLKQQPEGSDRIYLVEQEDFGGNSQVKYLVGYPSQSEAKAAYLQEMPEGFLKELREVAIDDLEEYRRRSDFEEDFAEGEWRLYFFEGRRTGIIARSVEEARKKLKRGGDKLVKVRSLTEAERKIAARGDWVRTGANHEPPGYPGKRGLGPKPKNYEEEDLEEFAEPIAKGSTVAWKYGKGTGKGKVVKVYREAIALKLQGTEIKRNGTEDNPALLIEQEDGARVLKLLSEVKRFSDYAEAIAIDSEEGLTQKEWDAIANSVTNPAIVEQVLKDAEEAIEDGEQVEFAEPVLGDLSEQDLSDLKAAIDEIYTDGVDRFRSVFLNKSGDIAGIFEDIRQEGTRKRISAFAFTVEGTGTDDPRPSFKPINSGVDGKTQAIDSSEEWEPELLEAVFSFSEEFYEFAAKAKGAVKKNCKGPPVSQACGGSCISANKTCKSQKPLSKEGKAKVKKVEEKLSGSSSIVKSQNTQSKSDRVAADKLAEDPQTRRFIELVTRSRKSDRQILREMNLSQEEGLKIISRVRTTLGVQPGQRLKDRLVEIYK